MAGCKCGLQKWVTVSVMGIPFMMCKRCGQGLPRGIVDKTMTHREMHEVQKKKAEKKSWKEEKLEIARRIWEEKRGSESNPRR